MQKHETKTKDSQAKKPALSLVAKSAKVLALKPRIPSHLIPDLIA